MVYRGTYKNGVVVLDEGVRLQEGQRVSVDLEPSGKEQQSRGGARTGDEKVENGEKPSVWQELAKLAGSIESGRLDASVNHDHYLYGAPKSESSE
jgi:predicted DNA-binding antitoxin AbrB/MazE fold protein